MNSKSVLSLYEDEQISNVLFYVEEKVNSNTNSNEDYDMHCEWLITGDIRYNIKHFKYILRLLESEDY